MIERLRKIPVLERLAKVESIRLSFQQGKVMDRIIVDVLSVPVTDGDRVALFYDAPGGTSTSHMKRNIGLAWLTLPLLPPSLNEE